jgi:hypothetical protein
MVPMSEIQDIFREIGPTFLENHTLSTQQHKVFRHIAFCRSAELGGHVDICDECGHIQISYNSCRDRHCPKCQNLKREQWLLNREEELLDVGYFHVVFTIPSKLKPLARSNQKQFYNIMFQAASQTLLELAAEPKYLGAQIGVLSVLHTWTQTLLFHPHIHCIVPGGGLSLDGLRFVPSSKKFFIPVKVLAKKFRGKLLSFLKKAFVAGLLHFNTECETLKFATSFRQLLTELYQINWVTYCKKPFKSPIYVLRYLGRYTHNVAISNRRIIQFEQGQVTIEYRDRKDNNRKKQMTISADEFIRRFLLHVLPARFVKIRYHGLFSNRVRRLKVKLCQKLLNMTLRPAKAKSTLELLTKLLGRDPTVCPICGHGKMVRKLFGFSGHGPPH